MILLIYIFGSLIVPIAALLAMNGEVINLSASLSSTAGLAILLFCIISWLKSLSVKLSVLIGGGALLSLLLLRFLLGFLYDFSGRGFSSEFFAHIGKTSFEVALGTYPKEIIILLILLSVFAFIAMRLIRNQRIIPLKTSLLMACGALALIFAGATGAPEILFAKAYARYTQSDTDETDSSLSKLASRALAKDMLAPIRSDRPLPIEKSQIRAGLPDKPLNLILVYLESFNDVLTNEALYPGLTPRINALKRRYQHYSQIYSSAFVTIEGIANSQCGTLFNMEHANNSLITAKGRLPNLPCLGDILHNAGYTQTYLGGAGLEFAGKGAFLKAHGYDTLLGRSHWESLGFERHKDWGLADNILFDQAFDTIKSRHQDTTPFNVTLLTLGMHIPGFTYEGCPSYSEDENHKFLNAIHCTDYLLGNFVEKLEESAVLQDTVLFIQADHGVFPNKNMKTLFGDHVYDSRLLTITAQPDTIDNAQTEADTSKEGSSLNTVATLLDALNISHNVDFVFAQEHTKQPENSYYLSRYNDHLNRKAVINNSRECDSPEKSATSITLPLDNCGKSAAMRAINSLNLSYSLPEGSDDTDICELGVKLSFEKDSKRINLTWGNQNLSQQFFWRGLKKKKHQVKGVYTVLLDLKDNVLQTIYYDAAEYQDIVWLNDLLSNAGETLRMFLFSNVDFDSLTPQIQKIWPVVLHDKSIVYADRVEGKLRPLNEPQTITPGAPFLPQSCSKSPFEKAQ